MTALYGVSLGFLAAVCDRLEREAKQEGEKEQEEMMGKLKDMGNSLLGKIGLSLDNFKTEQRADGSYNIAFNQ